MNICLGSSPAVSRLPLFQLSRQPQVWGGSDGCHMIVARKHLLSEAFGWKEKVVGRRGFLGVESFRDSGSKIGVQDQKWGHWGYNRLDAESRFLEQ